MKKPKVWLSSAFWRKLSDLSRDGFLAIISAALIVDLVEAAYTTVWPVTHLMITGGVAAVFGAVHLIANYFRRRSA